MLLRGMLLVLVASTHAARTTIDAYYEIMESPAVRGGCSPNHRATLTEQWGQMREATWIGLQATKMFGSRNLRTPPLAMQESLSNHMAILTQVYEEEEKIVPQDKMDDSYDKKRTFLTTLGRVVAVLTNDAEQIFKHYRTPLYCDSRGLQFFEPDMQMPNSEELLKEQTWYDENKWYLLLDTVPSARPRGKTGAYVAIEKVRKDGQLPDKPPYGSYEDDTNNPTFCKAEKGTPYSWTILRRDWVGEYNADARDVTILCPNYSTRQADTGTPLPSTVDVMRQYNAKTQLSALRPQWMTLFSEILYQILTYRPPNSVWTSLILPTCLLEGGDAGNKHGNFEIERETSVQGWLSCKGLADYDKAAPFSGRGDSKCLKSTENFAWYIFTVYMWYQNPQHSIWAAGEAVLAPASEHPGKDLGEVPNVPQPWLDGHHQASGVAEGPAPKRLRPIAPKPPAGGLDVL